MAESNPTPIIDIAPESAKTPGKIRSFLSNHQRKLAAATVLTAGAVACYVKGKKDGLSAGYADGYESGVEETYSTTDATLATEA